MAQVTAHGSEVVAQISRRHGLSEDATMALLHAVQAGHGAAAQFSHPELGGMGQWSKGGMTQIGDMFNDELTQKVGAACAELARHLNDRELFAESNTPHEHSPDGSVWWPSHLGTPSATGSQNSDHYALFAQKHRLAVKAGSTVTVYDSADHQITGFAQNQGNGGSALRFTTDRGTLTAADLRVAE